MIRTASLVVDYHWDTTAAGVAPATAVALPPSSLDTASDQLRVVVNGVTRNRQYDPALNT